MKTLLLAALLCLCCVVPATAASLDEATPYLSGQYFTWAEHSGGRRLLKESGALFSTGLLLGVATDSSLTFRGRAELFGGDVGYNGETQAPDSVPVRTDVSYFGTREEFDLGYRMASGSLRLEPFGGLGYRWWLRSLQNATSQTGQDVSGYDELWQSLYGRLGARGRYLTPAGLSIFAEGGGKYPFYTGNSVNFANSGTTTFRPGAQWSGFAETGLTYKRLKIAVSYEGFRFSRSPEKLVGTTHYFQPDSTSDLFGLSIGWTFK
jgi:hypothetical protein